jgi:hypothetical protein
LNPLEKRKGIFHDEGFGFEREFSEEREYGDSFETSLNGSRIGGRTCRNSQADGL